MTSNSRVKSKFAYGNYGGQLLSTVQARVEGKNSESRFAAHLIRPAAAFPFLVADAPRNSNAARR
jgi:hypothetical protein